MSADLEVGYTAIMIGVIAAGYGIWKEKYYIGEGTYIVNILNHAVTWIAPILAGTIIALIPTWSLVHVVLIIYAISGFYVLYKLKNTKGETLAVLAFGNKTVGSISIFLAFSKLDWNSQIVSTFVVDISSLDKTIIDGYVIISILVIIHILGAVSWAIGKNKSKKN